MNQLVVSVPAKDIEMVSDLLWGTPIFGIQQVDYVDADSELIVSLDAKHLDRVRSVISNRWHAQHRIVDEHAHDNEWKKFVGYTNISNTVSIRPPWKPRGERPEMIDVVIDPQDAFGHGSHVTTTLAAELLVGSLAHHDPTSHGRAVADIGCGTGVLGIIAAVGWNAHVAATDINPAARHATSHNVALNNVELHMCVSASDVLDVDGPFDVVVANIERPVLVDLAQEIVELVTQSTTLIEQCTLILSGFLAERQASVEHAYRALETSPHVVERDGWVALRYDVSGRSETSG